MKKKSLQLLGVFALVAFLLAACGPNAHIEKDKYANFSQYKTFGWIDHNNGKKGKGNDLEEQNVRDAVIKELEKSGWKEAKHNPDILVSYDVLVEKGTRRSSDPVYSASYSRFFYNPYSRRYGTIFYPSQFLGYEDYNVPVREGTLTITMVDTKTGKTVWQGWTTDEVNSKYLTHGEIQSSVKAIFRKFDVAKN